MNNEDAKPGEYPLPEKVTFLTPAIDALKNGTLITIKHDPQNLVITYPYF